MLIKESFIKERIQYPCKNRILRLLDAKKYKLKHHSACFNCSSILPLKDKKREGRGERERIIISIVIKSMITDIIFKKQIKTTN